MRYKTIDKELGEKMAPFIWNVFLSNDPDLFVTQYGNRDVRFRTYFDTDRKIYFHLTKEELLEEIPSGAIHDIEEVFLYGAFNDHHVKQIKVVGKLSIVKNDTILQAIHDRLLYGVNGNDKLKLKLKREDIAKAVNDLERGVFFQLTPISYELAEYETG